MTVLGYAVTPMTRWGEVKFLLILWGGAMSFYYPWKMAELFCLKVGPLFSLKGMGFSFEGFNEGVNGKSPI